MNKLDFFNEVNVGDLVECVDTPCDFSLAKGKHYVVTEKIAAASVNQFYFKVKGTTGLYFVSRFKKVVESSAAKIEEKRMNPVDYKSMRYEGDGAKAVDLLPATPLQVKEPKFAWTDGLLAAAQAPLAYDPWRNGLCPIAMRTKSF